MTMELKLVAVLSIGVLLRLCVLHYVPNLAAVLDEFVLFSTPVNSYRSLNEGIFLLSNSLNPYTRGEIVHHPPILLWFFNVLKESQVEDNVGTDLFFATTDLLICLQLIKINRLLNREQGFSAFKLACCYMFNPFTLLTTFAKSTSVVNNVVVVSVMCSLVENNFEAAVVLLAISTYLSYYTWYLLIPICYYVYLSVGLKKSLQMCLVFALSLASLFGISYRLCDDSFNFLNLCYMTVIKFRKITPNLGLWWYFFTEIFEFFNDFYLSVFNIYNFIFVLPLSLRFIVSKNKMNLLFVVWFVIGLINFTKAYPVVADHSLFYSTIFLFQPFYKYLKLTPLASYLMFFIVLLQAPTFYVVWMSLNSGNANFFYAIGLALGSVETIIMSDFLWAFIQNEYYVLHPEISAHSVKLTQV